MATSTNPIMSSTLAARAANAVKVYGSGDAAVRALDGVTVAIPAGQTLCPASRLVHRPTEPAPGQQQRVAAARALAGRPQIVFADEPTGNLASRASGDLLTFLRQAVREFGQTIVMVTHDPIAAGY